MHRLFPCGAWADKYEGAVHRPPFRGLALAMNEPVGVVGIVCPEEPGLLAFVSLMAAAIATGNTVVMVPSEAQALIATDLYQVLDTSDVPGGVVNIVTGDKRDARRSSSPSTTPSMRSGPSATSEGAAVLEKASTGNLKQTWCETVARDWDDPAIGGGRDLLAHATPGQEHLDPLRRIVSVAAAAMLSQVLRRSREIAALLKPALNERGP